MVKKTILDVDHGAVGLDTIQMFNNLISDMAFVLRSKTELTKCNPHLLILRNLKINYELFLQILIEGIM